ncbi:DUF1036 domain-containing protein [Streptomyces ramulosus]|uniref:DUF1036 domain-containing protein n=2 Tax=Streptomyces TaxID=1883 RepID=A0ABW1FS82_9ACTN
MLRFCNRSGSTVNVMIERYDSGCRPEPWRRKGWWRLQPDECKTVYGGDVGDLNRYWYFYAVNILGTTTWSGPYPETVPDSVFDYCPDIGTSPSHNIGMRQIDVGDNKHRLIDLTG